MLPLSILSFLSAAVLGLRLNVLCLLPATFTAWLAAIGYGAASGASWTAVGLLTLAVTVALQAGYLCGITLRYTLAAARVSRRTRLRTPAVVN